MSGKARYSYARAILGDDLFKRVHDSKILCVGAGGIGCEVLKNLVQVGFSNVTIIDLDTIDLSNLNRQFLFQKQHVKRPKAIVAKETANKFNPSVNIEAIHGNIKEPQYDVEWFRSFKLVMNALDNLDARRHVNKMCLAADVPLIESGTAGFIGQVQPIKKDLTECYDCQPKETPKGFPVCTIRSTPSTPIHCIVWAKSYLFPALFGVDDEQDSLELDKAAQAGENPDEINNLRKEALAMKALRQSLVTEGFQRKVVEKVFKEDIERLLSMEDMWKHRSKPTPLDYEALASAASTSEATNGAGGIKDQRILNTKDSFDLFIDSLSRLAARASKDPDTPMEWDKDDDDALDFATSAANLRASVFGIPLKTRFDVKQMAGNIIPAIATTNAIIAGAIILQALHILRNNWSASRSVWFGRTALRALNSTALEKPNPSCSTCRTPYVPLKVDAARLTLSVFIDEVVKGWLGAEWDIGIIESSRIIYDLDFEDNLEKTFSELNLGQGNHLQINDEEGSKMPVIFVLSSLSPTVEKPYETVGVAPTIPEQPVLEQPKILGQPNEDSATTNSRKRTASAAQLETPDIKKTKIDANGTILLDDDEDDDLVLIQ